MVVMIMLIDLAFDPHAPRQYGVCCATDHGYPREESMMFSVRHEKTRFSPMRK